MPGSFNWSSTHSTGPQIQALPHLVPKWPTLTQKKANKKILDVYFQLAKSVLTKERRDQLKELNSNVRGLCNGPCTQGACVRARFELVSEFSFQLA